MDERHIVCMDLEFERVVGLLAFSFQAHIYSYCITYLSSFIGCCSIYAVRLWYRSPDSADRFSLLVAGEKVIDASRSHRICTVEPTPASPTHERNLA